MRRALTLLVLGLVLAGCAPDYAVAPKPLTEYTPAIQLDEAWSTGVASDAEDLYLQVQPVSDGRYVYVASHDGTVTAVDAKTGDDVWETELKVEDLDSWFGFDRSMRLSAGPAVADGVVAVGSSEGHVVLLASDSGKIIWNVSVSGEVSAPPAIGDGYVAVRTGDGKLYLLDASDGSTVWSHQSKQPDLSLRGAAQPIIANGMVYAGFDNGRVMAFDLSSGKRSWDYVAATPSGRSELDQLTDVDGKFALGDGNLYLAAYHGQIAAVDATVGQEIWKGELSSYKGVSIDYGSVYSTDDVSDVWAYDKDSGNVRWHQDALHGRKLTVPVPVPFANAVAVGDFEGYVHLLSRDSGILLSRIETDGSPIVAPPLAIDGKLIVLTSDGDLVALQAKKGAE